MFPVTISTVVMATMLLPSRFVKSREGLVTFRTVVIETVVVRVSIGGIPLEVTVMRARTMTVVVMQTTRVS